VSKLDRYVLTQLLTLFGFFSLILVAVYWVNRAVGLFDSLIGDGQTTWVFLQMSALTLPNVISTVLPSSAFVAGVYIANRLTQDSELVVMRALGFSSFRLAAPVFYFGALVAVMMAILTNVMVPLSNTALRERNAEIAQNATSRFLKDGQFMTVADGVTLYIREITLNGELLDVFISDDRDPRARVTYSAQRALLIKSDLGPKLLMFDGMLQNFDAEQRNLSITHFADLTYSVALLDRNPNQNQRSAAEVMTWEMLRPLPPVLLETQRTAQELQFSGHYRLSWPLSAAAAGLIGFSTLLLGAFSRFGLWRQIMGAVALLIVLYAVDIVASTTRPFGWISAYSAPAVGLMMVLTILQISQGKSAQGKTGQRKAHDRGPK
jgi:lipopolysaccharide export system permease protein